MGTANVIDFRRKAAEAKFERDLAAALAKRRPSKQQRAAKAAYELRVVRRSAL